MEEVLRDLFSENYEYKLLKFEMTFDNTENQLPRYSGSGLKVSGVILFGFGG